MVCPAYYSEFCSNSEPLRRLHGTTSTSSPGSLSKQSSCNSRECPASDHSFASQVEISEKECGDSAKQYWDNVFLNSHLSVHAWKAQSKVIQKAPQQTRDSQGVGENACDNTVDGKAKSDSQARRQHRKRRKGIERAQKVQSIGSKKKDMPFKVKVMS